FAYAEPNYIADAGFTRPPRRDQAPASQGRQPGEAPTTEPAPAPETPAPPVGGAPTDPLYALQWQYRPRGAGEGQSAGGAGFLSFWEAAQVGSRAVRVAVLDTGIDLSHPDIAASGNVVSGIDMIVNPERGGDDDGVD